MKTEPGLLEKNDEAGPAQQITLRLHELLARVLAEQYGESLRVDEADRNLEGNVRYAFDELGFRCTAHSTLLSERAGAIVVCVRLGRLYKGYRQALRWLACNRAGNTVGLYFSEETNANQELWVSSHRVTFPDDEQGIREMLLDVKSELVRLRTALGCNFPQLLQGDHLAMLEEHIRSEKSEGVAAILACPQGFVDAVERDGSIIERTGLGLPIDAATWVCDWGKRLKWLDMALNLVGDEKLTREQETEMLGSKLAALARLNRHEESLRLADRLERDFEGQQTGPLATIRCHLLCGLGRYEDLLEMVRSAIFDVNPRVWFWRSIAHARLGQVQEAIEAFSTYEGKLGTDIVGRKELKKALPVQEEPPRKDDADQNLEIKL